MNNQRQTWTCKIGVVGTVAIPPGADAPMRDAAFAAFKEVTRQEATECFSGWGDTWTEGELAVIENREPDFPDDPKDARIAELEAENEWQTNELARLHDIEQRMKAADNDATKFAIEASKLRAERDRLREAATRIRQMVDTQALDEGLWFIAETAAEAYLQQELRRLHAALEGK